MSNKQRPCGRCQGTGKIPPNNPPEKQITCPRCNGTGILTGDDY